MNVEQMVADHGRNKNGLLETEQVEANVDDVIMEVLRNYISNLFPFFRTVSVKA